MRVYRRCACGCRIPIEGRPGNCQYLNPTHRKRAEMRRRREKGKR